MEKRPLKSAPVRDALFESIAQRRRGVTWKIRRDWLATTISGFGERLESAEKAMEKPVAVAAVWAGLAVAAPMVGSGLKSIEEQSPKAETEEQYERRLFRELPAEAIDYGIPSPRNVGGVEVIQL